tara:strand:- start:214 stop:657 length:444 start_codon:yes stop_codon:yes gene_type:complete
MVRYIFLLSLIILTGCATRLGDFTLLSTRNVDLDGDYVLVERSVEGEDLVPIVILFPIGTPNLENAIDDALKSAGGDLMTDAVLTYNYWYIPYVYGVQRYSVEGDVWRKASNTKGEASQKLDEFSKNPNTIYLTAVEKNGSLEFIEK